MSHSSLSLIRGWMPEIPIEPWVVLPHSPAAIPADEALNAWEVECIHQTRRGHPEAFNPIVAHYAPRIRAYLYRMLRDHEEAEDLTQETFLRAFRGLDRFDSERPFKAWLYTIATHTGLNAIRDRRRKGVRVALDPALVEQDTVLTNDSPAGEQLELALATLSPRAVQLITLHYHEGFSLQEAGAVLGMSEGAAKAALCRARQELRRKMTEGRGS